MTQNKKKYAIVENIFSILVCILLGGIAISISSKNSFLYEFNDSGDIQVFVTTARCMLRGDVLYRDVFDVKGPYLYFLYALGLIIDGNSFSGIFLLESILFIIFVFLNYKIADLYLDNKVLKVLVAASAAFASTVTYDMFGGGQCEELLLPFFAATIYIVLKYFRQEYPKRIPALKVIIIGVLASVVFWTKYTLLGLFLGVVIYLVYLQVRSKRIKELWIYIGEFLCGFLLGTIPVLVYFASNHAIADLLEVYFYNLIFRYKSPTDDPINIFRNNFYVYYIGASALTAFAFFYPIIDTRGHMKNQEKKAIVWMIFMQTVGICFSRHWQYSAECMHAFSGLGMMSIFLAVKDCRGRGKELLKMAAQAVNKFLNEKSYTKWYFFPLLIAVLLLSGTEIFILPVVVVVGAVVFAQAAQSLSAVMSERTKSYKKILGIKYAFLILSCYVAGYIGMDIMNVLKKLEPAAILYLFVIAILLVALDDYWVYMDKIDAEAAKLFSQWKQEYQEKRIKTNVYVWCLGIVLFSVFCFAFSKSTYDIGTDATSKPQYRIAEYINNSGIEDPVIINYRNIDKGIYWLTNTYPSSKYSCGFNIDIPEIDEMYDEYINGKKADFIIVENEQYSFQGYKQVYVGKTMYVNSLQNCTLILLEKESEESY